MPTLNEYAARIANVVNQPWNMDVLERAKDAFKDIFANRIRQSTERHGIDSQLKLSIILPVVDLKADDIYNNYEQNYTGTPNRIMEGRSYRGAAYTVPVPTRIHNDSPFTYVGTVAGKPFLYGGTSVITGKFRAQQFPNGRTETYYYTNGKIIIEGQEGIGEVDHREIRHEILVEGIFESPEKVLGFYIDTDEQDIELPFPRDMMESIVADVLKFEFQIYPKSISLELNQGEVPSNNSN